MGKLAETDLYAPVKAYLCGLGYDVKGEVGAADVVARRADGGAGEMLIVELKTGFSLTLLQQAVARQAVAANVYVAVPRWKGKPGWRAFKGNVGLCRRLGLGVMSVNLADGHVQVHADPAPFQPRRSRVKQTRLIREFDARKGDPTQGGTNGQVETAYRQDALSCLGHLAQAGPSKGADVAKATGVGRATRIMASNHYGWFSKVARGIYGLSDAGQAAASAQQVRQP